MIVCLFLVESKRTKAPLVNHRTGGKTTTTNGGRCRPGPPGHYIHHDKENSKNSNQIKYSVAGEDEIKYT